jgi:hypothetical protein
MSFSLSLPQTPQNKIKRPCESQKKPKNRLRHFGVFCSRTDRMMVTSSDECLSHDGVQSCKASVPLSPYTNNDFDGVDGVYHICLALWPALLCVLVGSLLLCFLSSPSFVVTALINAHPCLSLRSTHIPVFLSDQAVLGCGQNTPVPRPILFRA